MAGESRPRVVIIGDRPMFVEIAQTLGFVASGMSIIRPPCQIWLRWV